MGHTPVGGVPYKRITGLPPRAQFEIERNFAQLHQDQSHGTPLFIAASDAEDWEKGIADLICSGSHDELTINEFIADHHFASIDFSSGTFNFYATVECGSVVSGWSVRLRGCTGSGGEYTNFVFHGADTDYTLWGSATLIKVGPSFGIEDIYIDYSAVTFGGT